MCFLISLDLYSSSSFPIPFLLHSPVFPPRKSVNPSSLLHGHVSILLFTLFWSLHILYLPAYPQHAPSSVCPTSWPLLILFSASHPPLTILREPRLPPLCILSSTSCSPLTPFRQPVFRLLLCLSILPHSNLRSRPFPQLVFLLLFILFSIFFPLLTSLLQAVFCASCLSLPPHPILRSRPFARLSSASSSSL